MLASLKASRSARKAAVAHLVFNVIAVFITLALYKFYVAYIPRTASSVPHQIANAHVAIKVVAVLLFLPFTRQFARLIDRLVPGEDKLDAAPEYLNAADLTDAPKALVNVKNEIRRMSSICLEIVGDAVDAFFAGDEIQRELVLKREDLTDDLYDSIAGYVLEISKRGVPSELTSQPHRLMHIMGDVERVGDHAENIVELSQAFGKNDSLLSGRGESDIRSLMSDIIDMGSRVDLLFDSASRLLLQVQCVSRYPGSPARSDVSQNSGSPTFPCLVSIKPSTCITSRADGSFPVFPVHKSHRSRGTKTRDENCGFSIRRPRNVVMF
jgi:phosphate:Na+ symporter